MITDDLNKRLKLAVAAVRKPGEVIEVWWDSKTDSPWDQHKHGSWDGDLASMKELRKWLAKNSPDGRLITIYCCGEDAEVIY